MAASYPKIWTSILHEDWFIELSCLERGILLQLYILAKENGDTGTISYRSSALLAAFLHVERRTFLKFMAKIHASGRIITVKDEPGLYVINIPKYRQYQDLRSGRASQEDGKNPSEFGKNPLYETKRNELKRTETNGDAPDGAGKQPKKQVEDFAYLDEPGPGPATGPKGL